MSNVLILASAVAAYVQQPHLAGAASRAASRVATPLANTYLESTIGSQPPPAAAPPARVAETTMGKVVPTGPPSRPARVEMRPNLEKLVHESSDLLSHQAIMENFVRNWPPHRSNVKPPLAGR